MRLTRRFLLHFLLACLSILSFFSPVSAQSAAQKPTKLHGHLQIVRGASRAKLRQLKRVLGVDPEAPVPTVEVLVRMVAGEHIDGLRKRYPHSQFHTEAGPIATGEVPIGELDLFETDDRIVNVEPSHRSKPNLNIVKSVTTSGSLNLGILEQSGDLANANGAGVIVGVIDTGIDYHHADFKDSLGNTRLLNIWDQLACANPPGPCPNAPGGSFNGSNFIYGIECSQAQINAATCAERDTDGHGTNVMGIAAGNGRGTGNGFPANRYVGVASGADLIMVKSDFTDAHAIDGMNYLINKANNLGKKLVINMSFGSQYNAHDGTSALESAIGAMAASVPMAVAMGNDNLDNPHANFTVPVNSTVTAVVNTCTTSGSACYQQFIDTEFWYPGSDEYTLVVKVTSASTISGSVRFNPATPAGTLPVPGLNSTVTLARGTNSNGDKQLFIEVDDLDQAGKTVVVGNNLTAISYSLGREAAGSTGLIDGYTQPAVLGTSFANLTVSYGTLCSPAAANNVFAVGAYNTKNSWTMDNGGGSSTSGFDPNAFCGTGATTYAPPVPVLGTIADFSAVGPRRNGASNTQSNGTNGAKPDIVAPGEGIAASLSTNVVLPSAPNYIPTGSVGTCFAVEDGVHFVDQGTSQATPVATGVMAVMLGVNPALTVPQIRAALQSTARSDPAVGGAPNNTYGAGKIVGAPTKVRVGPTPISSTVLGTSSITFSWNTVANATSYNLYDGFQTPPAGYFGAFTVTNQTLLGLSPNALYSRQARGVNGYGEGPSGTLFVAATLANQPVGVTVQPAVTSITVTFAAGAGGAAGFSLYGTTATDTYSGTLFSSATNSGAATQLTLTGLTSSVQYCLRLSSLNQSSVQNPLVTVGCYTTLTPYVQPPISQSPVILSSSQIELFWTQGANPVSVNYTAQASADPTFTVGVFTFSGIDQFQTIFSGLSADTSYYFRVKANNSAYSSTSPFATLAGLPVTAAPAFTNIAVSSVVARWGYGPNPADALFLVQASTDPTPAFYPVVSSSQTSNNFGLLTGLNPNTTYYARVQAIGRTGIATAFVNLGFASTLGDPPVPTTITGVAATSLTGNYTTGGNGPGTIFLGQVSVDPTAAFSPVAASSQTYNTFATLTGLVPNQQYFFRAGAYNNSGGINFNAFGAEISAFTLPVPPVAASPGVANQTISALTFNWSGGTNASGTQFTAQDCANATCTAGGDPIQVFAGIGNSQTFNTGLAANTTYYAQAKSLHQGAVNPDSAFALVAAGATLALQPTMLTVQPVDFTSFTVTWLPLNPFPLNIACEGYRVQAALDAAFNSIVFSQDVYGDLASSMLITGLAAGTPYFVRVGSLNWNNIPNYEAAVSTQTLVPIASSGVVTGSGLSLTVNPVGAAVTSIQLVVPPMTLPTGTPVTINTSVAYLMPPPVSNEGTLVPLAPGFGFSIDAANFQPVNPVDVVMHYDPTRLPAASYAQYIQLARFDPVANQWTLLPTTVDASQNIALGVINHFSLYAPFLVTPADDLSRVNIFPTPWEPLSANTLLNAPVLTFTNMPGNASVRIVTIQGALVYASDAAVAGTLTWNGTNRFGRVVGSGTYIAIIKANNKTIVKRVVIVR